MKNFETVLIDKEITGETIRIDKSQIIRSKLIDCKFEISGKKGILIEWKDSVIIGGNIKLIDSAADILMVLLMLKDMGAISSLDDSSQGLWQQHQENNRSKKLERFTVIRGGKVATIED